MKKNTAKFEKGATLVEIMTAVAIFAIMIIAATNVFISTFKNYQHIIAKQEAIDNARYAMEFMIKELRMAKANPALDLTFRSESDAHLANGAFETIVFTNSANNTIKYSRRLDTDGKYKIMRSDSSNALGYLPISSDNISVDSLKFIINDWDLVAGNSAKAPLVVVFMRVTAGGAQAATVDLQSTVAPRLY